MSMNNLNIKQQFHGRIAHIFYPLNEKNLPLLNLIKLQIKFHTYIIGETGLFFEGLEKLDIQFRAIVNKIDQRCCIFQFQFFEDIIAVHFDRFYRNK